MTRFATRIGWLRKSGGMRSRLAGLLLALVIAAPAASEPIRVTDLSGREITVAAPAHRIVLGSWVSMDAISLLDSNPLSLVVAWGMGGSNEIQPEILGKKFPEIGKLPVIGRGTVDSMSVEAILAQRPDLLVLSKFDAVRFSGSDASAVPQIAQLQAAGVPVVVVDFYLDPLANTEPSLRILGQLTGRSAQAEAFLSFYKEHMDGIRKRLANISDDKRPSVFLHAFAGRRECCFSAGNGTLDGLVRLAGGHNIGADLLRTAIGQVSLESVLKRNPDVYIATAVGNGATAGFALGIGVSDEQARRGFAALLRDRNESAIGAVERGQAFGLWHLFVHTPLHVVAAEVLAKWLHPDLFSDVDPARTMATINTRYLAAPVEGTLWTGPATKTP